MPQRIHKYDRSPYPVVMRPQDRRYRKAFFWVERLTQIDPQFRDKLHQIRQSIDYGRLSLPEGEQIVRHEVIKAVKRQAKT